MKYLLILLLFTSCVMTLEKENARLEREYPYKAIELKKYKMKSLDKKIDEAWAKIVKLRAGMKCEYCGKTTYLNSHHVYSRSKRSTRWDLSNGVSLCVGHHTFGEWSAHKNPIEFIEWIKEKRGQDWYNALRLQANTHLKLTKLEKQNILFTFTEIIKRYETENINN